MGIHPILLVLRHSDQKGRFTILRVLGSCQLLLLPLSLSLLWQPKGHLGATQENKENYWGYFPHCLWAWRDLAYLAITREIFLYLCLPRSWSLLMYFGLCLVQSGVNRGEKTGKLIASWVVLWILVLFLNLHKIALHLPETAVPGIPSKFYSCTQWGAESAVCSLCLMQKRSQSSQWTVRRQKQVYRKH